MGQITPNQVTKSFGGVQVITPLDLQINDGEFVVFVGPSGFIGSPKTNLIEGAEAKKHDVATICIRPEHLTVTKTEGAWKGRVGVAEHPGPDTFIHVHDTGLMDMMTVRITGYIEARQGDMIHLTAVADQLHRFDVKGLRIA